MKVVFQNLDIYTLQQLARKYNHHMKIPNITKLSKKDLINKLSSHLNATYDTSKKMYKIKVIKSNENIDVKTKPRKKPIKKVNNKPKPVKSNISKLFPKHEKQEQEPEEEEQFFDAEDRAIDLHNLIQSITELQSDDIGLDDEDIKLDRMIDLHNKITLENLLDEAYTEEAENRAIDLHHKINELTEEPEMPIIEPPITPLSGGEMPTTKANLWTMEDNAYSKNPIHLIDGWSLIQPFSTGIKAYRRGNDIMIAVRGTDSITDVYADSRIANGSLRKSQRYQEDRNYILNLQKEYNTQDFFYFGVGHSLGGAICDLLIDEGIIQEAVSYNPAIEDQFLHNTKNYRIYNEDDPLYKIMGRRASNVEVRKNNLSTFDKLAGLTSAGKLKNTIQAHSLSKFRGGNTSWRDLKRNAVGLSGGDWADTLANAFGIDRQGSFTGELGKAFGRVIPIAKAFA